MLSLYKAIAENELTLDEIARVAIRAPAALTWTNLLHWGGIMTRKPFKPRGWRATGVIGAWGKGLAAIMGVRFHERNRRDWNEMGDMIVANHMGFLDVPVLLAYFPAVFVIKMEMRRVFYFGRALADEGHVFVDRGDRQSHTEASKGVAQVLEDGDRIIIFPEGRASPGAERRPFKVGSFAQAQRLGKKVEVCVIDYLPDRKQLEWDVKKPMFPQLVKLFGRKRTDISVEFFPPEEVVGDPAEYARRWHDIIQGKLEQYDREREAPTRGKE
jgi:1-acyl-sn-glycerol-3-phosphate acyltransferase